VRGQLQYTNQMKLVEASTGLFIPNILPLARRNIVAANAIVDPSGPYIPVRVFNVGDTERRLYKSTCLGEIDLELSYHKVRKMSERKNTDANFIKAFANNLECLPRAEATKLTDILIEYEDIFSKDKMDIGCVKNVVHHIDTGDALPVACAPRRVPQGVEDKVDELVEQLVKHNIIRPSTSPWNAPIVVVRKKDGDIRLCVDYRRLNAVTRRPIFPIPEAQQLFDTLDGARYFSCLDLSQGYHQVPVATEDIQKTAFTTRRGQYEYLRMPMGLCSAPSTFQRLMHTVLKDENWHKCLIYLDDVLIYGKTPEEHHERLKAVFQRIREANLKLSPSKCTFFQKEVEYLGHVISDEGIKTSPSKVEKVSKWPSPKNAEEVRSFLGLCGYYRRFIKDYAVLVAPLEKLCLPIWNKKSRTPRTHEPWKWIEEHEKAFLQLKWCLTHSPVLTFPRRQGRFILDTDASHDAIGAVLSQIQDNEEKVIAYASHKLTKAERGYCITRKELLAVYKYVLTFKHYLYGRQFSVRTDHQALTWLLNWKKPNTSQYCTWIAELECYDMEIIHRPGKLHTNADALSRIPQCQQCEINHQEPMSRRNVKVIDTETTPERALCKISFSTAKWRQEDDDDIHKILQLLKQKKTTEAFPKELEGLSEQARALWTRREQLRIRGELLYLLTKDEEYALIIPRTRRSWLVRTTHEALGHVGVSKTLSALKNKYFWPRMEEFTRLTINSCRQCAERKSGNTNIQPFMQRMVTGYPFEKIAIDISGPFPSGRTGERYILGIIDCFSKYPVLVALKSTDSKSIAAALIQRWISIFGAPLCIHSDRGSNFESEIIFELCAMFGIKKTRTAPYRPQSDGLVERLFRTVKDMVYATSKSFNKEWVEVLPLVEMGLRSTMQSTTKVTPFEVIFGKSMQLPLVWLDPTDGVSQSDIPITRKFCSDYIIQLQGRLSKLQEHVVQSQAKTRQEDQIRMEKTKTSMPFSIGEYVMVRILPIEKGINLPRYSGPYVISDKKGDWTYVLTNLSSGETIVRNHHHLKRYYQMTSLRSRENQQQNQQAKPQRNIRPPERFGFSRQGECVVHIN
jgi:transposase InsO family protein